MNGGVSRWCYFVSGFFLLDTTGGLGVLSRLVYGTWAGKGGDPITQSLNVLMFAASLTLFSCRRSKRRLCPGQRPGLVGGRVPVSLRSLVVGPGDDSTGGRHLLVRHHRRDRNRPHHGCRRVHASAQSVLLPGCNRFDPPARCLPQQRSIHGARREWRLLHGEFVGIFAQKNVLGQVMATGVLATLHGIRVARYRVFGKLCMLLVFLGMAYASKSTGALMAALLFCGISAFDSLWRKGGAARMTGVIFAIFLTPLIIVAVIAPDRFLVLIGKDPTLTGRSFIWAYVIKDIWVKPWLGWGYFGFWQLSNPYALEINKFMQWVVPHAHNGLLESLLNVGIAGHSVFRLHSDQDHRPGRPVSPHVGAGPGNFDHLVLCRDSCAGRERDRVDAAQTNQRPPPCSSPV